MANITVSEPFGGDFKIPDLVVKPKPEPEKEGLRGYYFSSSPESAYFYCPSCILDTMAGAGVISHDDADDWNALIREGNVTVEQALDDIASDRGIDRSEHFNTSQFPHRQHVSCQECRNCDAVLPYYGC